MNRAKVCFPVFLLTFAVGLFFGLSPVVEFFAASVFLKGLIAAALTLSTAIVLLSGVIRLTCGKSLGNLLAGEKSLRGELGAGERR